MRSKFTIIGSVRRTASPCFASTDNYIMSVIKFMIQLGKYRVNISVVRIIYRRCNFIAGIIKIIIVIFFIIGFSTNQKIIVTIKLNIFRYLYALDNIIITIKIGI